MQDAKLGSNLFSQAFQQQQKVVNKSVIHVESGDSNPNSRENSYYINSDGDNFKKGIEVINKNIDNLEE